MLRFGETAAQIGGHVRLGNLVASGALAGVDAGHQTAQEQIQRSAGGRCGRQCGSRCGSWDRDRAPAARRSPLPVGLA